MEVQNTPFFQPLKGFSGFRHISFKEICAVLPNKSRDFSPSHHGEL
jgi:hypothetical protein